MPPTITNAEVLRRSLETDRADLHTALPGKVRAYDAAKQTAEIVLSVRQVTPARDDDDPDSVVDYPVLSDVPVLQLRGAGFFIHMPVAANDHVLVLFCESDLNEWRRTGDTADPGVATRHGLSGAVCIPGIHHQRNALGGSDRHADEGPPVFVMGKNGGPHIAFEDNEIHAGGSDELARWAGVDAHLTAISNTIASLTSPSGPVTAGTPYLKATVESTANTPTQILKGS